MRRLRVTSLFLALAAPASAQTVTEIPALTRPYSEIDMDALPVGNTDLLALHAAGSNGGANLADLWLRPTAASGGTYNLQTCGYALAAEPGSGGTQPRIINGRGGGAFDSFALALEFSGPAMEFGLMAGDWGDTLTLSFFRNGSFVTQYVSTVQLQCTPQFYAMSGGDFDRVEIETTARQGNVVFLELYVERVGLAPALEVQSLVAGQLARLTVIGATPLGTIWSAYSLRGPGPIPTRIGDLLLSLPVRTLPTIIANAEGAGELALPIPASATGRAIWFHALDVQSLQLSNGWTEAIG
ncbi:MAG: hypothetical protein MK209_07425 [Planctomycetes bacterium]|nr:hypothetical protein [Planctomycetota bacterium]